MRYLQLMIIGVSAIGMVLGSVCISAHAQTVSGERLKTHFKEIDTNNDGKISQDEYLQTYTKRFKALDTNDDGFLTKEEVQETAAQAKEKVKKRLRNRLNN